MVKNLALVVAACAFAVLFSDASADPAVQLGQYITPQEPRGIASQPIDSDDVSILTESLDFTLGFERRRGKLSFVSMVEVDPSCDVARDPLCWRTVDPPEALLASLNLRGCFLPASRQDRKTRRDRKTDEAGLGYALERPGHQGTDQATVEIHGQWYQLTVSLRKVDGRWKAESIRDMIEF